MITAGEKNGLGRKRGLSASRDHSVYTGVPTVEYEDGRDEKPWQRVIYEVTRKGTHLYEPVKSVPCTLLVILVGVYLLLAYLTQLVEDDMPRVINEVDIPRDNSVTFSEEVAWRYLHTILGDQPRVSGTRYHLQKTQDLKTLLDSVAASANLPVRTEWQMATDDYWLAFNPPHVNVYQNVSNIFALLEGESGFLSDGSIGTTLLVNAHYDSVPYAIGASDDGVFCAVMMETLSKLSRRTNKLKHNVVFLFNGAEENPLQAAHAFIAHPWARGVTNVINLDAAGMNGKPIVFQGSHAFLTHPWAKGISNVINLDAGGMNGKPILFQVTDPRLLDIYARTTNRPNGQSIGEFMFATGIIPSDTDFRIWRDFGQFHGVDIAFTKWGHVYHTRNDRPELLLAGVMQNAGNMLLALVSEAADTEELRTQVESSAAVYWDYLNWFMVTYSYGAAIAVDILVAIFACLSVAYYIWLVGPRMTTVQELLFSALGRVVSMLAGIAVAVVLTPIMVSTTQQLRYLSEPWVVVPLFWLPYILAAVCASQAYDAWRTKRSGLNRSIRTLQAMTATRAILVLVLLVMTCIPAFTYIRYMITVPLFIMSLMAIVSMTVVRYFRMRAWMHLIMEVAFSIPSSMFMFTLALRFTALLLPIMGRSHSAVPDYTIAIVNVGLAVIVCTTVSGIELLFSRRRLWLVAAPLAAACVVAMFVPWSPYSDTGLSTQRHYWFHSQIVSYDYQNNITYQESGVVVTKHDAYSIQRVLSALRERSMNMNTRLDFGADCERFVHCNLPLFRLRFGEHLKDSLLLQTGPPAAFDPESSTRLASRACVGDSCTFNFVMTGPAHNLITLWPRPGVNITSWSFASALQPSFTQLDRPVYVIVHSTPTYSDVFLPLQFNITFTAPASQHAQPVLDLTHHAHEINHPEHYTAEYANLVQAMPQYFNIASFLSFRRNYVF